MAELNPSWLRVGVVSGIVAAICCAAPAVIALVGFALYTLWQRQRAEGRE